MKEKQIKTLPVINNSNQIKHEYECLCPNIECNQINGEDDLLCKRCEYDLTCTPLIKKSIQDNMANKLNNKVTGSLWRGHSWKEAIKLSIDHPDCGVEKIFKDKNPHLVFCEERVLSHYQLWGYGNRCKKYITRIPEYLNEYLKEINTRII